MPTTLVIQSLQGSVTEYIAIQYLKIAFLCMVMQTPHARPSHAFPCLVSSTRDGCSWHVARLAGPVPAPVILYGAEQQLQQ